MAAYNEHIANNDKVEFIHVSMDDSKSDALKWSTAAKFPWLHVLSSKSRTAGMLAYDQGGMPQYYLITKNGEVLASKEDTAFAKIKELTK